mmetsp:Transcript_98195/g.174807  ORF Transcript_98195/g.174807 Transcript_98195/m.174807 type:complete len:379 (-) Transcript_98195:126-1262(-)
MPAGPQQALGPSCLDHEGIWPIPDRLDASRSGGSFAEGARKHHFSRFFCLSGDIGRPSAARRRMAPKSHGRTKRQGRGDVVGKRRGSKLDLQWHRGQVLPLTHAKPLGEASSGVLRPLRSSIHVFPSRCNGVGGTSAVCWICGQDIGANGVASLGTSCCEGAKRRQQSIQVSQPRHRRLKATTAAHHLTPKVRRARRDRKAASCSRGFSGTGRGTCACGKQSAFRGQALEQQPFEATSQKGFLLLCLRSLWPQWRGRGLVGGRKTKWKVWNGRGSHAVNKRRQQRSLAGAQRQRCATCNERRRRRWSRSHCSTRDCGHFAKEGRVNRHRGCQERNSRASWTEVGAVLERSEEESSATGHSCGEAASRKDWNGILDLIA